MDIIIYHNSCPDGWTAAYIAKLRYPEAKLMPRDHGLEPPYEEVAGKDVLVVDFSWRTREQNDKLANIAKSFKIFDHHKTAEDVLHGASYAIFDMKRSGAGLSWDYLFGKDSSKAFCATESATWTTGKFYIPAPWWVNYVEDRDLWKFSLPKSQEVNAYIMTFSYDIESWDSLVKTDIQDAMTAGKYVLLQIEKYVRDIVKQAKEGSLNVGGKKHSVGVVNAPYLNISEVGHALAHRWDIGMGWFERADGMIQFSLRSLGDVDVSEVVKHFGGGGHKNAAGFQLSLDNGRELIDTILNRTHMEIPENTFGVY